MAMNPGKVLFGVDDTDRNNWNNKVNANEKAIPLGIATLGVDGNLLQNIDYSKVLNSPYSNTYTPLITKINGSINSATNISSKYIVIDKTVIGYVYFQNTTTGTSTAIQSITLPITPYNYTGNRSDIIGNGTAMLYTNGTNPAFSSLAPIGLFAATNNLLHCVYIPVNSRIIYCSINFQYKIP